ncbi:hypothetical protein ACFV0L_27990 [Streptosporangium canum]|uniref:hypothetical protein n=1 Tax=Streptosporangium canum TaxID=324952 RepID=UPI0036BB79C0
MAIVVPHRGCGATRGRRMAWVRHGARGDGPESCASAGTGPQAAARCAPAGAGPGDGAQRRPLTRVALIYQHASQDRDKVIIEAIGQAFKRARAGGHGKPSGTQRARKIIKFP